MRWWIIAVLLLYCAPLLSQPDSTRVKLLRFELREYVEEQVKTRLKEERALLDKEFQLARQELESSLSFYVRLGGVIVFLLTLLGAGAIWGMLKYSREKYQEKFDQLLYRIDPRDMPIRMPGAGMEKQHERLKKLEFRNLKTYDWLDESCTRHGVIFKATSDVEAQSLRTFMEDHQLRERQDVVFVVYTEGVKIDSTIFAGYENVTFANNHLTLVQALFVAARGTVR